MTPQDVNHVSKGKMFVNGDRTVVKFLWGLKSQNSCCSVRKGLGRKKGSVTHVREGYKCAQNDIISMVFNVKDETLSFHHNGKDLGPINFRINMQRKYKMTVFLYKIGPSLQISEYDETYI